MRRYPSIRAARCLAAACAALLGAARPAAAQFLWQFSDVPDANPPATSALGVPCLADFSAPTAAANILGFWDTQNFGPYGYWNAGGVTGGPLQPLPGHEVAEHLSWFMATNSQRDSGCASTGANTWGRTNARTGGIAGTRPAELGPGFVEFARWDGGLYPFTGPTSPPPLPAGKTGYNWRPKTLLPSNLPGQFQNLGHAYGWYIFDQPVIATFQHWHLTFLCAEGGIEYYDWLPSVSGTDDPAFAPNYAGGGTPPAERWNGDNLGHAVTGIGIQNYQPSCTAAPRDWAIVRDGIPNTGATVAVPLFTDAYNQETLMTSLTIFADVANRPDLAVDAAGHRHVVWGGGPIGVHGPPSEQIYYAGDATPGAPLEGTATDYGKDPSIAIDPNTGHVAIAFVDGFGIRMTTNALGYWNSEDVSNTGPVSRNPSIAIDAASNTHVVWQAGCDEFDPCPWGVDVRLYSNDKSAGGSWGTAQPLFDPDGPPADASPNFDADLAVRGTHAYLVYDHGHGEIQYLEGTISGGAITWDLDSLQTVNVATGHPVRAPKIAVDDSGDVYVVWSDQRSGTWQTYHQARRTGSWLAADLALSSATTSATAAALTVRSAPNGTHVYATWEEELPAGNYEIVSASLYHGGGGAVLYPGPTRNLSASAAPSRTPAIAYNAAAGAVDVAWADEAVMLPEAGTAGLLAGFAALALLRRKRSR